MKRGCTANNIFGSIPLVVNVVQPRPTSSWHPFMSLNNIAPALRREPAGQGTNCDPRRPALTSRYDNKLVY
jgi:hypothetical protein